MQMTGTCQHVCVIVSRFLAERLCCGFAADSLRFSATDHFGITGMRERVEQMGGSFTLRSSPGEGTSAIAVLPLTPLE
jgi:glucose-6-phosphate-specific signal transduction histidine kinase